MGLLGDPIGVEDRRTEWIQFGPMISRVLILARPAAQHLPMGLDLLPTTRLDGLAEFLDFGRNFLFIAMSNRARDFKATSRKLANFARDNFFRRGPRSRAGPVWQEAGAFDTRDIAGYVCPLCLRGSHGRTELAAGCNTEQSDANHEQTARREEP